VAVQFDAQVSKIYPVCCVTVIGSTVNIVHLSVFLYNTYVRICDRTCNKGPCRAKKNN